MIPSKTRRTTAACAMVLSAVLCVGAAFGVSAKATGRLNDTGDTDCGPAGCAGTGRDGEFGRDATARHKADGRVGFSFVKVCNSGEVAGQGSCPVDPKLGAAPDQWACTKDKVTGLIWEVKTRDGGLRDGTRRYTQLLANDPRLGADDLSVYVAAVNAAGLCGKTDWRVPKPVELQGIVDYSRSYPSPMIVKRWFPNTAPALYWTPTNTAEDGGASAWVVSFYDGVVGYTSRSGGGVAARLVRSGEAAPAPQRFLINGPEATDTVTGLVWRRCSESLTWSGTDCTSVPGSKRFTWREALVQARSVAQATGVPWRLANAKELMSLVDHSGANFWAIDSNVFAGATGIFWTSTLSDLDPWAVRWSFGELHYEYTNQENGVYLVRDAAP